MQGIDMAYRTLTPAQQRAIAHVQQRAHEKRDQYTPHISKYINISWDQCMLWITNNATLTVNFHPDRLCKDGRTVAQALLDDGIYKSQFQTGISNGGLTAFPGGDRDKWEERMFGGSYQEAGDLLERPRYGGLNVFGNTDGACPRFGSCHLRLKKHVLEQSTFSYGDSVTEPEHMGVLSAFEPILYALLENVTSKGGALGLQMNVEHFACLVSGTKSVAPIQRRALDEYIEAQIHTKVDLMHDVDSIVADYSFKGTEVEDTLLRIATTYNLKLEWNGGFMLDVEKVTPEFRSPLAPPLAIRIAKEYGDGKTYNVAMLGKAAQSVVREPEKWTDWSSPADALQHIKYLWHTLVVFGTDTAGGCG